MDMLVIKAPDPAANFWLPLASHDLTCDQGLSPYLPLEFLRDHRRALALFEYSAGVAPRRAFRSSGTTGEPDNANSRSISFFSPRGLARYRETSVAEFLRVLNTVLPPPHLPGPDGAASVPRCGISLIPQPRGSWRDSSLAQMVAWISDSVPLSYAAENGQDLRQLVATASGGGNEPIWLFGTAIHFMQLLEKGMASPLPTGSVIIETGGPKGQRRTLDRGELYQALNAAFAIPTSSIISEYGMCELACQAYDYIPWSRRSELQERWFRFPPWVKVSVLTGPATIAASGRGALVITDPERVDYPWPLRTEDLAQVKGDGRFRLCGRVPRAPLKGCSLRVEDIVNVDLLASGGGPGINAPRLAPSNLGSGLLLPARIAAAAELVTAYLQAPSTLAALASELGSNNAAAAAITDMALSLPPDPDAWRRACSTALREGRPSAEHWHVILPDSHPLVGIYPIAIAAAAGLSLTVRMPKTSVSQSNGFLSGFLQALHSLPGANIEIEAPTLRIDDRFSKQHPQAAILAYGSDATIATIRALAPDRVQGFGDRFGISLIDASSPDAVYAMAPGIARDALGLAQQGCVSSRLVLWLDHDGAPSDQDLARQLTAAGMDFWGADLPWQARVALDIEAMRMRQLGMAVFPPPTPTAPLITIRSLTPSMLQGLDHFIAQSPFCLPVLRLSVNDSGVPGNGLRDVLGQCPTWFGPRLGTITVAGDPRPGNTRHQPLQGVHIRPLGQANILIWDGCHEGRTLFVI